MIQFSKCTLLDFLVLICEIIGHAAVKALTSLGQADFIEIGDDICTFVFSRMARELAAKCEVSSVVNIILFELQRPARKPRVIMEIPRSHPNGN